MKPNKSPYYVRNKEVIPVTVEERMSHQEEDPEVVTTGPLRSLESITEDPTAVMEDGMTTDGIRFPKEQMIRIINEFNLMFSNPNQLLPNVPANDSRMMPEGAFRPHSYEFMIEELNKIIQSVSFPDYNENYTIHGYVGEGKNSVKNIIKEINKYKVDRYTSRSKIIDFLERIKLINNELKNSQNKYEKLYEIVMTKTKNAHMLFLTFSEFVQKYGWFRLYAATEEIPRWRYTYLPVGTIKAYLDSIFGPYYLFINSETVRQRVKYNSSNEEYYMCKVIYMDILGNMEYAFVATNPSFKGPVVESLTMRAALTRTFPLFRNITDENERNLIRKMKTQALNIKKVTTETRASVIGAIANAFERTANIWKEVSVEETKSFQKRIEPSSVNIDRFNVQKIAVGSSRVLQIENEKKPKYPSSIRDKSTKSDLPAGL